jgi:hypothetical protein
MCYVVETGRPQAMRLRAHTQNMRIDLLEESKLGHHVYEESHGVYCVKDMI